MIDIDRTCGIPCLMGAGFPGVLMLPHAAAIRPKCNLHSLRPLRVRVLLKATSGACGIITITPFRNGPENHPLNVNANKTIFGQDAEEVLN